MKKLQENINLTDALQEITGEYTEDYVSLHDQFQQVEKFDRSFMLLNKLYNIQQDLYKSVTDPKAFRSKHVGSHKYADGRNKKKKNKRIK